MMLVHHYGIIQNIFTVLRILCASPIQPLLLPTPSYLWSLYCLNRFAFSRVSYRWNHTLCNLFSLSLICTCRSSVSFCGFIAYLFLVLSTIPLFECSRLFVHSSTVGHLAAFKFWQLWIKLLNSWVQIFMWASIFSYQGVWLLHHTVKVHSGLWGTDCKTVCQSGCTLLHSHQL